MRKVDDLFARYSESHRNPTNKAIHWVCVPLITWSVLALLWAWSPIAAYGLIGIALVFYAWLSPVIAIGMLGVNVVLLYPLTLLGPNTLAVAVAVFVLAWIGQFIGHKIEGKKPSFFEDLQYLWVGPLFVLSKLFGKLGVRW